MPVPMSITRGTTAPTMTRGEVTQGMVFAVKDRTGRTGTAYAAIGANGRCYSVNLNSRALASSGNRGSRVSILGKWKLSVNRTHRYGDRIGQDVTRRDVRAGEIFVVSGGQKEYAHLGRIDKNRNGWLSLPLSNLENHAVAENGESRVRIVGTYEMSVTLSK